MSAVEHPAGAPSLNVTNVHFDLGYVVASGTAKECQIEASGQHRCKNSWSGDSTGRFWPLANMRARAAYVRFWKRSKPWRPWRYRG